VSRAIYDAPHSKLPKVPSYLAPLYLLQLSHPITHSKRGALLLFEKRNLQMYELIYEL